MITSTQASRKWSFSTSEVRKAKDIALFCADPITGANRPRSKTKGIQCGSNSRAPHFQGRIGRKDWKEGLEGRQEGSSTDSDHPGVGSSEPVRQTREMVLGVLRSGSYATTRDTFASAIN